jgi:hypothetical protein
MKKEVIKYFYGDQQIYYNGGRMPLSEAKQNHPQFARFAKVDSFDCVAGCLLGQEHTPHPKIYPATRKVFYKIDGSKHKCDARCLNAKGHNCECACGGSNHGAGTNTPTPH